MNISIASGLIPLLAGCFRFRSFTNEIKPIIGLIIFSLLIDGVSEFLISKSINTILLLYFYSVGEFCFLLIFYNRVNPQYWKFRLVVSLAVTFAVMLTFDYYYSGLMDLNVFSTLFECFVFIFSSLLFFWIILKNLVYDNLLNEPLFWVNTAILVYFAGNLMLFALNNFLSGSPEKQILIWGIVHTFYHVVYNILLAIAFWKLNRK